MPQRKKGIKEQEELTPKRSFNWFKFIAIPSLLLLATSVFALGVLLDDEGNFNIPWRAALSAVPTLASTDTYGCPHAEGQELEHTAAVTKARLETQLTLDISSTNDGDHYQIDLVVDADHPTFLVGGNAKKAKELLVGEFVHLTGDIFGKVQSSTSEFYTPTSHTPDTNGRTLARVVGKSERWTDELLYVHTQDEVIQTTPEHPFLVNGEWIEAKDIQPNDQIETRDGGFVTIKKTEVINEPQMVYNLHVEGAHTFFVGEGQLLTHNNDCFPTLGYITKNSRFGTQRIGGKTYSNVVTNHSGGMTGAEDAFEALTGRRPSYTDPTSKAPVDSWKGEGFEVFFRPNSTSDGSPVLEIFDHGAQTVEKIHFVN